MLVSRSVQGSFRYRRHTEAEVEAAVPASTAPPSELHRLQRRRRNTVSHCVEANVMSTAYVYIYIYIYIHTSYIYICVCVCMCVKLQNNDGGHQVKEEKMNIDLGKALISDVINLTSLLLTVPSWGRH